ncbi:MAG: hypothetical protein FWD82_00510 [Defluviitaleaceae bacterium]|nr:hypothetical protein [Defluviitaleaceae bacterium]
MEKLNSKLKKIILILTVAITIVITTTTLLGCDYSCPTDINFNSQYIRTDWIEQSWDVWPLPNTVVRISNIEELNEYIGSYSDWEDFGWWDMYGTPIIPPYFNTLQTTFTENFFLEKQFIIVRVGEGSGSNRHRVTRITQYGEIFINRILPGRGMYGTADVAVWSIIIELPQAFNPDNFTITFSTKSTRR